jgi:hypothetical protein
MVHIALGTCSESDGKRCEDNNQEEEDLDQRSDIFEPGKDFVLIMCQTRSCWILNAEDSGRRINWNVVTCSPAGDAWTRQSLGDRTTYRHDKDGDA